jgi:peptide/nickel transport system substrate-binding protein
MRLLQYFSRQRCRRERPVGRRVASRALRALGVLAVLGGAVAVACGPRDPDGSGGTVVVGLRSDFGGFNPVTSSAGYDIELMNYALFTPLVQYDENLEIRPYLAESWQIQEDTAIVFQLRQDVYWHDGEPVTAHDVEFTFNLAKTPEAASLLGSAFLGEVESARVIDDYTVVFRFTRPHAQALDDFWWAPAPRHLLLDIAPAELRNAEFNRRPVGSGPFRFGAWRANEQLTIVRNADFPDGLGGPAAAERVVFRVIPEASTMLTEVLTGRIHMNMPLPPDQVGQVRSTADTDLLSYPGRTVYYLGWNNARPPFDDVLVRRGLAHAINRKEIVDALLHGEGTVATSTIPPWNRLYPDIQPLAYDLDQAGRLLDQAGWTVRAGDGMRQNAAGARLTFTLLSSDDPLRRAVVEVLQSQLRRVGADVQVRVMEFQTMLQSHRDRDFDAVFTNWVLDNFKVASAPLSLLHSSQADIAQSANRSGVRDPRLDAAIERGARATDEGEQRAAWREFTQLLQQEQPITFMFWLNDLAVARSNVYGVEMDPRGQLRSIAEWTVSR